MLYRHLEKRLHRGFKRAFFLQGEKKEENYSLEKVVVILRLRVCVCVCVCVYTQSCLTLLRPHGL